MVLELADGEVTRSKVKDCNVLVEAVVPAIEGAELPSPEELLALARA